MFGVAIKNVGTNIAFTNGDLSQRSQIPNGTPDSIPGTYEIITESFQIPSQFEMSMTYGLNINEQNNLLLASAFTVNNSLDDVLSFGLEYGFISNFFVRGGYGFFLQNAEQSIYGLTLGAGVDYNAGGDFSIIFDYAYKEVKEFPSANHIFTIKMAFE